ncbi:MAG: ATP phosphoribosyltransferase regulatory subunit [Spirochaetales bacterium]|nr:ATP phosphoribosyltransferase regulatory subunit [Spirochaetales bacterium]
MTEKLNLKGEERVVMALRSLYRSYGYRTYRMSRFEEYDLYAGYKDFLVSGNMITFTDTDGKLMALKPDVTLSIVRSLKDSGSRVSRICYDENVYRVSDRSGTFREIMQAGLECIGEIGLVELSEVAVLAQKSLKTISGKCMLTISHMGIIERILNEIASEEASEKAVEALSSRNRPRLTALAKEYPDCAGAFGKLAELSSLTGSNGEVLSDLRAMGADEELVSELESVVSALDEDAVRIDFSVLGGMKYYNGIIFRGYVEGVPVPVLSGGQYDRLMRRMGKRSGAIGFAVYMDPLERMLQAGSEYDVDTVLLYSDGDDMKKVLEKDDSLRSGNRSVMTLREIPSDLRYRDIVGGADA